MGFSKCFTCNKNITKKVLGIVCSRCDKRVHATHECAKLSNKQLATLRNAPGLEWSCAECLCNASQRSSTIVSNDESENEEEEAAPSLSKDVSSKLIAQITSEMKKIFKKEFEDFKKEFEISMTFMGEQMSNMEERVKCQEGKIKQFENKNTELTNKNKNLELRMACMETQMQEFEQKLLSRSVEIAGLPEVALQNPHDTIKSITTKLKVSNETVASTRCMPTRKDHPCSILVELTTYEAREQWITAARQIIPTVIDILPNALYEIAKNPVFIREALTQHNKMLLYNAKKTLRQTFEFIWCKNGKVFARKTKASKVHYIRSLTDIESLTK